MTSRWIQDRQNHVDVFQDELGLVVGGGNTKLQPYWSTFTVGDPGLLRHTPGDEDPNFTPQITLKWVADKARLQPEARRLYLNYGEAEAWVEAEKGEGEGLALVYHAPAGKRVEARCALPEASWEDHLR